MIERAEILWDYTKQNNMILNATFKLRIGGSLVKQFIFSQVAVGFLV